MHEAVNQAPWNSPSFPRPPPRSARTASPPLIIVSPVFGGPAPGFHSSMSPQGGGGRWPLSSRNASMIVILSIGLLIGLLNGLLIVDWLVDWRNLRAACERSFLFNKSMRFTNRYKTTTNQSSFEAILFPRQSGSL